MEGHQKHEKKEDRDPQGHWFKKPRLHTLTTLSFMFPFKKHKKIENQKNFS